MASPVSITTDEVKTVIGWVERALKKGMKISDLQCGIDEPHVLERQVRSFGVQADGFKEPKSHEAAREILGPDFHGFEAIERCIRPLTWTEKENFPSLRLRDEQEDVLLEEDQTLEFLQQNAGKVVLAAAPRLIPN